MAQVVVVTSGKGGVGKTTSTAALGAALARAGERVVVIDFDVGLRNLDLVMGAERRVVFDLIHVVQGTARLSQALIRDKRIDTLFLLAASQTRDKDVPFRRWRGAGHPRAAAVFRLDHLRQPGGHRAGGVIGDAPCRPCRGGGKPGGSSVRDFDRIIGLLDSTTDKAKRGELMDKYLLLTRYDPARAERGEMLCVDDVLEILHPSARNHS